VESHESRLSYTPDWYGGAETDIKRRGIPEVDRIGSTGLSMTIKASNFRRFSNFSVQIYSITFKRASYIIYHGI
jgi:hypothetical protein